MNKILYIAEGEIEERFIKFLTQNDSIQAGRFKKFNLMQNRLADSNNILSRNVNAVYCILDTDLISQENISKLLFNLKQLQKICPNGVYNLIQNVNFEDELKFVLECRDLGNFLNLPHNTEKDLKQFLAQNINYRQYITNENLKRYCSRPQNAQAILKNQSPNIKIVSIEKCMLKK